jgi:hypothetical protein
MDMRGASFFTACSADIQLCISLHKVSNVFLQDVFPSTINSVDVQGVFFYKAKRVDVVGVGVSSLTSAV